MAQLPDKKFNQYIYPTLNGTGIVTCHFDEYTREYLEFCKKVSEPVLDIGAAYGFTVIAALEKGATVVANDLSQEHLDILQARTPADLKKNLTCVAGTFPQDLDFAADTFDAIYAGRMFHFLMPDVFRVSMEAIANWLRPGGKFFIVAEASVFMGFHSQSVGSFAGQDPP